MNRKLKIAWFTPQPRASGEESSSAYATRILLPVISDRVLLERFGLTETEGIYDYRTAIERHRREPYDLFFYQVEDSPESDFIRRHLMLVPGVVLFHDVLFSDLERERALRLWQEEISRRLACPATVSLSESPENFGRWESRFALAALFSSERNLSEFRRHSLRPLADPMEQERRYLPYPVSLERGETNVDSDRKICFCGSINVESRPHKILKALSHLPSNCSFVWVVSEEERVEAEKLCNRFLGAEVKFEVKSPRLSRLWEHEVRNSSLAVHTRFSAFGDLGPWLPISLASGTPCVVNNFASAEWLPSKLVYKIESGLKETGELEEVIRLVLAGGTEVERRKRLSRIYAEEVHSSRAVADSLILFLCQSAEKTRGFYAEWFDKQQSEISSILEAL